jgi:hypothetical protein
MEQLLCKFFCYVAILLIAYTESYAITPARRSQFIQLRRDIESRSISKDEARKRALEITKGMSRNEITQEPEVQELIATAERQAIYNILNPNEFSTTVDSGYLTSTPFVQAPESEERQQPYQYTDALSLLSTNAAEAERLYKQILEYPQLDSNKSKQPLADDVIKARKQSDNNSIQKAVEAVDREMIGILQTTDLTEAEERRAFRNYRKLDFYGTLPVIQNDQGLKKRIAELRTTLWQKFHKKFETFIDSGW